ncbi:hypothetical protein FB446DRAFT_111508 [Lentinula raphanica]|nr:hypothetical protein FB446DRAFT_111508 [Lentinula raphanica]
MYLFRIIFTRRSLAAHVFLLSMIATAIALPMVKSKPKPPKKPRTRTEGSTGQAGSSGQYLVFSAVSGEVIPEGELEGYEDYEFAAVMSGHKSSASDPTMAQWVMALIPSVYLTPTDQDLKSQPRVFGYRTIRDPNSSKWTQQRYTQMSTSVTGARIIPNRFRYTIAKLRMSPGTKGLLTESMGAVVDENHTDKLPTIPSGYQYALLFEKLLKKPEFKHIVEIISFDISETSEYGEAFTEMIKNKRTEGGKVLNKKTDSWEWELYEQIEHYGPTEILEKSLDSQNRYLLEGSWSKLHGTGPPTPSSQNTPVPATSPQNLLLPATSSQNSPLPGTLPQNSPHPNSPSHDPLFPAWAYKEQDIHLDPKWKDPENWKHALASPADSPGHRSDI